MQWVSGSNTLGKSLTQLHTARLAMEHEAGMMEVNIPQGQLLLSSLADCSVVPHMLQRAKHSSTVLG